MSRCRRTLACSIPTRRRSLGRRPGLSCALLAGLLLLGAACDTSSLPDSPLDSGAPPPDRTAVDGAKTLDTLLPDSAAAPDGAVAPACNEAHPDRTLGLQLCTPEASPGYTLLVPMDHGSVHLLDLQGQVVHSWKVAGKAAHMAYLLPNGNLLRTARVFDTADMPAGGMGGANPDL